ncbi:MAG: fumarylacetoacetate hydrolase family protein [bacterium]
MTQQFVRFSLPDHDEIHYGRLEGDNVIRLNVPPWLDATATDDKFPVSEVELKAPVEPSKIICIGLNYHAHVAASQSADKAPERPLMFLKPPSAVIGHQDTIVHPPQSQRVDYEAELGVVIGCRVKDIDVSEAAAAVFGLTCVNDVTARDLQKTDGQWSRAKGFDTFCPVGPSIVTGIEWNDLLVEGILNGEVRQSGRTSLMIFPVEYLISYISSVMTLLPGDLISTGTPAGIAPMKPGDEIQVRISSVGMLTNRIV